MKGLPLRGAEAPSVIAAGEKKEMISTFAKQAGGCGFGKMR